MFSALTSSLSFRVYSKQSTIQQVYGKTLTLSKSFCVTVKMVEEMLSAFMV